MASFVRELKQSAAEETEPRYKRVCKVQFLASYRRAPHVRKVPGLQSQPLHCEKSRNGKRRYSSHNLKHHCAPRIQHTERPNNYLHDVMEYLTSRRNANKKRQLAYRARQQNILNHDDK